MPLLGHSPVDVQLAQRTYTFRRLTWQEEVVVYPTLGLTPHVDPRRVLLAHMLVSVDGTPVEFAQSLRLMRALRAPILDRVYVIALGKMPDRRILEGDDLYAAPAVKVFVKKVITEEEEAQEKHDDFLTGVFGREEVEEEREMEAAILQASKKQGAIRLDPFTQEPLEGE